MGGQAARLPTVALAAVATTGWIFFWTVFYNGSVSFSPWLGFIEARGAFLGFARERVFPNPFFSVSIVAMLELWRVAAWRARRYAVTDRRVVSIDRRGRVDVELPLPGIVQAVARGRDLVFEDGVGNVVRFDGVEDREGLLSVLRNQGPELRVSYSVLSARDV
jgi:hypothetical protein